MSDRDEVFDLPIEMVKSLRNHIGDEVEVTVPAKIIGVGTKAVNFEVKQAFDKPVSFSVHTFKIAFVEEA